MRRGSGPILAAIVAGFLALFSLQRCTSPFLRIEAERELAEAVAVEAGLSAVDVMALRELLGAGLDRRTLTAKCAEFVQLRGRWGEGLAAVAVQGQPRLVEEAVAAAGGDASAAWTAFLPQPQAAYGVRFLQVRERFAGRLR